MSATPVIQITAGAELPDRTLTWLANDGSVINFSTGYTFTLRIGTDPVILKATGITGAATAPNITIQWSAGELDNVPAPAVYEGQLWARRTSDNKDRDPMPLVFRVRRAL